MATLPKSGYQRTGYSEPFITDVVLSAGALAAQITFDGANDDADITIAGAMRIENTEYRNQVTWGRAYAVISDADEYIEIGEDTTQLFRVGDIIEYLDDTTVRITEVIEVNNTASTPTAYSIRVDPTMDLTDGPSTLPIGTALRTTGRILDLADGAGSLSLTGTYIVGDHVTEEVDSSPDGTYALDAPR